MLISYWKGDEREKTTASNNVQGVNKYMFLRWFVFAFGTDYQC